LLLASRGARADEFQDHLDHAGTLAQADRYKEALAELDAAYALRQSPRVLYMMAKVHQRLGDAKAALASYESFLTADADPDPRFRSDAQDQAAKLKHLLGKDAPPSPPVTPAREPSVAELPYDVHYETKPSPGLMTGGAVLFGSGYLAAVISGSIFLGQGNSSSGPGCSYQYTNGSYNPVCPGNLQVAGGTLLIPVLGPFIAALAYREPSWSTSWPLIDGVAQVGGLAMMIHAAKHPKKVPVYGQQFQVLPYGGKTGSGLRVVGQF
jgi:hypothetical protein